MDGLASWLEKLPDSLIPPFCVELVLVNGARYFVAQGGEPRDGSERGDTLVLRIWDLREYNTDELFQLRASLRGIKTPDEVYTWAQSHPKLDWANLRVPRNMIGYCIEWHDRIWPIEERAQIGFAPRES